MEPLQTASSNSKCPLTADHDVGKHPSLLPATSETPETLLTAGSSKLKQARILFPPAASLPHPTTPITAVSQRGDGMSSEDSGSVETFTLPEDQHQADITVQVENPVFSATNEEAMDVTGGGETDPELPLGTSTDVGVGIKGNTTPQLPKPGGSCAKSHKVKLTKTQRDALRAERERTRIEAKAKREAEKQLKEQEKKERREKREQEIQERRERKEQEERERREKRETEQRKKEEERKKKEEEKKRKEDEKKRAGMEVKEELRKKEQAKERFLGFFSKLPKANTSIKEDEKPEFALFTPFSVKPGMTLAKPPRPSLSDTGNIDTLLQLQDPNLATYLRECRAKKLSAKSEAIVVSDAEDENEVMIVSSSPVPQVPMGRYKLIQFHTNYRPAYYGTWRRRSKVITPRNPFRKDEDLLDYEVDSDDEWEEEDPGESLSHSENEEDSGEDSEEDDGFFVPHGYLSEGEGEESDGEVANAADNTDECRKQKQLAKAKAWEAEFARKCHPLKPVQVWCTVGRDCAAKDVEFLQQFAAMALVELPVSVQSSGETTADKSNDNQANDTMTESTKRPVPEEAMPELIKLVHGSAIGVGRLIKTFRVYWGRKVLTSSSEPSSSNLSEPVLETPNSHQNDTTKYENASGISKRQLEIKIQSIATKDLRPSHSKPVWFVHDFVLQHYGIDPQEMTPLVVSPPSKSTCDKPKMMSPETPCSNSVKRGIKRKTDGTPSVKTLFEVLPKSPAICKAPKETKTIAASKHTPPQVVNPPSTSSPPTKKVRLNKNEPPTPSSVGEVIVIQSDDSLESSNNVKENMSADSSNATSIIVTGHPTTLPSSPNKLMKIHLGALQECTNALGSECGEPAEPTIDWQKLLLNRNKVVVSADIH